MGVGNVWCKGRIRPERKVVINKSTLKRIDTYKYLLSLTFFFYEVPFSVIIEVI